MAMKGRFLANLVTFIAITTIVWCLLTMFYGCRIADKVAWTYNEGTPSGQSSAWLGSQQVMPVPFAQPVQTIDWKGIAGIVAVQVLTWWLGRRDRRIFHGGKK